ncbi:MAG: hypothetical protein KDD69_07610, partial [Bdellovibrionales bacterium]|nr:hypothetical protein [Bdellovibrionales bacterium]
RAISQPGDRIRQTAWVLSVLLLLDSSLWAADYAQAMPLQAIRRIVPGWLFLPLSTVTAASMLMLASFSLIIAGRWRSLAVFVLLAGVFTSLPRTASSHIPADESVERFASVVISPSYQVVRDNGVWILRDREAIQSMRSLALPPETRLQASSHLEALTNVLDQDRSTRWSSERGFQTGDEWLLIELPEARPVRGIALRAERFYTDYPRGLAIEISKACDSASAEFQAVARHPSWLGAIRYTDAGFPYYLPSHQVEVVFPESVSARCIRVLQIAQDRHYDWSVDSVELLIEGER